MLWGKIQYLPFKLGISMKQLKMEVHSQIKYVPQIVITLANVLS